MTLTFAVAGKGGVGKTTFAALLIKILSEKDVVLAVDADPNSNLNYMLGVDIENTIGDLREDITKDPESVPVGMSKQEYIEYQIRLALIEGERFDLVAMGRQEGPGCYCYINNVLRAFLDSLSTKYKYVVMDNEAGMEHLSRRTTRDVDHLFILSNQTKPGVLTAMRIGELSQKVDIGIANRHLIINRADGVRDQLKETIENMDFNHVDYIPEDNAIAERIMLGKPLLDLPDSSPALERARKILEQLGV